jgi:aminoglycoside phosphotransferase (APT) family kinase protein
VRGLTESSQHDLDERILQWVLNSVDYDATVESVRKLKGSTTSTLHHISLKSNQVTKKLVVRQFDNKEWVVKEPDVAHHEADSLRMAEKVSIQTPEIIAFDETGEDCGIPVVLMTMLEGFVDLKPKNMSKWLDSLAESLVKIHAVEAADFAWEYFTYNDIPSLEVPSWSNVPKSWEKAIEIVKGPQPTYKKCFIHRDFHPTNVLWKDGAVSGVVDWVNACRGPVGIDVGHCRLNLAMLYGVETADAFLTAYEQNQDHTFTYDPYWDFLSLIDILFGSPEVYPGWAAFGITGLTDQMMEQRLDMYVESLVR